MMKTNSPCGGLLNPAVVGQLFVWLAHVRLFGLVLEESLALSSVSFLIAVFLSIGWLTLCPLLLVPCFSRDSPDSLASAHLFGSLSSR